MSPSSPSRPHGAYALIVAVYLALLGGVAARVRRTPELLTETPPPRELFLLGLATYRLSRLLTYDRVTSVLRLPVVEEGRGTQHLEGTQEQAKGTGLQLALGQLFT